MKVAALHLERIARGKKTRSWFKWYVEHLANLRAAATTVQARARGVAGRDGLAAARGAARAVQRAGRQRIWVVSRHRGAAEVQRLTRGRLERKWLVLRKACGAGKVDECRGLLANATPRELLRSWGFAWAGGQRGVLRWLLTLSLIHI